MTKEQLLNLINNDAALASLTAEQLRTLTADYPYFQIGQALLAKKYQEEGHENFAFQKEFSATNSISREILMSYLNEEGNQKRVEGKTLKAVEEVKEKEEIQTQTQEQTQEKLEVKKEKVEGEEQEVVEEVKEKEKGKYEERITKNEEKITKSEAQSEKLEEDSNQESQLKIQDSIKTDPITEPVTEIETTPENAPSPVKRKRGRPKGSKNKTKEEKEALAALPKRKRGRPRKTVETPIKEKTITKVESTPKVEAKPVDASGSQSFMSWLTQTSDTEVEKVSSKSEPVTEPEETTSPIEVEPVVEEERILESDGSKPLPTLDSKFSNYIQEEISKSNIKKNTDTKSDKQVAKESIEFDLSFVTETLASIYAEQGKKDLAIRAFEQLILKYPEKSSYFADRIEELKK